MAKALPHSRTISTRGGPEGVVATIHPDGRFTLEVVAMYGPAQVQDVLELTRAEAQGLAMQFYDHSEVYRP